MRSLLARRFLVVGVVECSVSCITWALRIGSSGEHDEENM